MTIVMTVFQQHCIGSKQRNKAERCVDLFIMNNIIELMIINTCEFDCRLSRTYSTGSVRFSTGFVPR